MNRLALFLAIVIIEGIALGLIGYRLPDWNHNVPWHQWGNLFLAVAIWRMK